MTVNFTSDPQKGIDYGGRQRTARADAAARAHHTRELTADELREACSDVRTGKPLPAFIKLDADKLPLDLITPEMMTALGEALKFGAAKYAPRNWEKGAEWSRYYSALQRHLWAFWSGVETDEESGLPTLSHAACCLMFLLTYHRRNIGTDNREGATHDKG